MRIIVESSVIAGFMLTHFMDTLKRKAAAVGATLVTKQSDITLVQGPTKVSVSTVGDKHFMDVTESGIIYLDFRLAQVGKHYRMAVNPWALEQVLRDAAIHSDNFKIAHQRVEDYVCYLTHDLAKALIREA